ncbi:cytohesin-interacting protein [Spea bombifrons]|uniref:cytohesin-interacting protein n=1 Tax=Spea bombifrons TaxID=233779 RepID=UPI00234B06D4|nr:cytohesin-interacting protein [Spea bombifrons]
MSSITHRKHDSSGSKLDNDVLNDSTRGCQTFCSKGLKGKRNHSLANILATLPREHRRLSMTRSDSLTDSTGAGPQRRLLFIVKQDNEPFGFELQTYKLHHQHTYALEMLTYVCKVQKNSPSAHAGLKTGDMLTNINGISTEGFSHQQTVDLIRSSGNLLRIEATNGAQIRRSELEARLMFLKHDLHEKWTELQTVFRKEHQLIYGAVNEAQIREVLNSLYGELFVHQASSPSSFLNKHRFSSGSSYKSHLSFMTDTSEEGQTSWFDEDSSSEAFSRQSSIDDDCFFVKANGHSWKKSSLSRHRTISVTSSGSGSMSPNWDTISLSNFFGTLPRKSRKGSTRKHLLKFIPGLHRSVKEEDIPV